MNQIYADFIDTLVKKKNADRATLVFLHGDLGAGKTTFTKNLMKYLNLDLDITSPTFTILKKYDFDIQGFKNFIHIDAYRLASYADLLKIRFDEYLNDVHNLIFIEWPSVIADGNLKADIDIMFTHSDREDGERAIKID